MNSSIIVNESCVICNSWISEQSKDILKESNFAQTWCIPCIVNWINTYPKSRSEKIKAKNFLKKNGIQL